MRRSRRPGIAAAAGRASGRGLGEGRSRDRQGTGPAGAAGCKGEGSPAGRMEAGVDHMAAGRSLVAAAKSFLVLASSVGKRFKFDRTECSVAESRCCIRVVLTWGG